MIAHSQRNHCYVRQPISADNVFQNGKVGWTWLYCNDFRGPFRGNQGVAADVCTDVNHNVTLLHREPCGSQWFCGRCKDGEVVCLRTNLRHGTMKRHYESRLSWHIEAYRLDFASNNPCQYGGGYT